MGEAYAREFLQERGFLFLEQNWRCPRGEIDLIFFEDPDIVVVEVKTRRFSKRAAANVFDTIGYRKQQQLRKLTQWYVRRFEGQYKTIPHRIDVVGVLVRENGELVSIEHIKSAI